MERRVIICANLRDYINKDTSEKCYKVGESYMCEYSDELFDGIHDPICEYVEKLISDARFDGFDGYSWESDRNFTIDYGNMNFSGEYHHVLYYNGEPVSLFFARDVSESLIAWLD